MFNRDHLLSQFCKAFDMQSMTKVASDALETLQQLEMSNAFKQGSNKKLEAQVVRQRQIIDDLEKLLKEKTC